MSGSAVLVAGTTPRAVPRLLHSARLSAEACNTRNARNPLPELCGGLRVGDNIISQLANKERKSNPDEDYFIANIEGQDKKIDGAGIYSCVSYKKGYWVVCARWYVFVLPSRTGSVIGFTRKVCRSGFLADQLSDQSIQRECS